LIDEAGETIELGTLDICRPLIAGRHREHHHLLHARTRYPEMARCRPFTHAAPTREADLPVKFHAENTPPSLQTERAKVAKFYSARSKTSPPLPWLTFALTFSTGSLNQQYKNA